MHIKSFRFINSFAKYKILRMTEQSMLFTLAISYGNMFFFYVIETNSYDLSVKSDTNASLVKYEGVIHKFSFINDEIDECYILVRNSGKG